jgi:hypothetical protein
MTNNFLRKNLNLAAKMNHMTIIFKLSHTSLMLHKAIQWHYKSTTVNYLKF